MQGTRHHSTRDRRGSAADHFTTPILEMLESRQLMSVVPSVGLLGTGLAGPIGGATHAPPVAQAAATNAAGAANGTPVPNPLRSVASAAVVTGVPGSGAGSPSSGGQVSAAKSLWGRIKGAAKWVKDHVVIGLHNIGVKGKF